MNKITVNGKKYTAKAFDFNTICELEDMGVALQDAQKKPMSVARAYFAVCAGLDADDAGKELEQHIIGGGKFDEIINTMTKEMEKSDFFQALGKKAETENPESETEKTE